MQGTARQAAQALAAASQQLHAKGWVANHDGNITTRHADGLLATPGATSKRVITASQVIRLDASGAVLGPGKAFSELGLHLAVYAARRDVHAVVHAHCPHATALACSGRNLLDPVFLAEAVVSLGPVVPLLPFAAPGPQAAALVRQHAESADALLLGSHGVLTYGPDLETAMLRLELVEHLATIALAALPLGGPQPLPQASLAPLLEARAKAGLQAPKPLVPTNGDAKPPPVACTSHPNVATRPLTAAKFDEPTLAQLIRAEIVAAIGRH